MGLELSDGAAEGEQSKFHKLEVLNAEGDADDGDAEKQSPAEMSEGDAETADKPPYNVHYPRQASRRPMVVGNVSAERPKRQRC